MTPTSHLSPNNFILKILVNSEYKQSPHRLTQPLQYFKPSLSLNIPNSNGVNNNFITQLLIIEIACLHYYNLWAVKYAFQISTKLEAFFPTRSNSPKCFGQLYYSES